MAVTIVATPGAPNANSYVALADAESYVESNFISTDKNRKKWSALSNDDKSALLIKATNFMNRIMNWSGDAGTDQALHFPVVGDTVVPADIVQGQVEVALGFLAGSIKDGSARTLDGIKVGSVALDYAADTGVNLLPSNIEIILRKYGTYVRPRNEDNGGLVFGTWRPL